MTGGSEFLVEIDFAAHPPHVDFGEHGADQSQAGI